MKKICLIALASIAINTYADIPFIDTDVNQQACLMRQKNNLAVCILNKTGEKIYQNQIALAEHVSSSAGGRSAWVKYQVFYPASYLVIQTSNARLKKGDQGDCNATVKIVLEKDSMDGPVALNGCEFAWHYLAPPYQAPIILVLEKINGDYQCHFSR